MVDELLREQIREAYQRLTDSLDLTPRWGQRQMIAEVANALGDPEAETPIAVVEAGTGTGKTIAYLVAALPIARARGKTLVLASATVALQEQLLHRDLPDVLEHSGLEFEARLAKGRGRYVCLLKLDHQLAERDLSAIIPLYPDEIAEPDRTQSLAVFEEMVGALATGYWDGDFDSWSGGLAPEISRSVASDQHQCSGRLCPHVAQCSFFRAREGLQEAEIIVTNHDLVLSDLRLGGGVILPAPEDCFYVFDEGHQLPAKCLTHFAHRFHAASTLQGLRDSERWLRQGSAVWVAAGTSEALLEGLLQSIENALQLTEEMIQQCWLQFESVQTETPERAEYRFKHGQVPAPLAALAQDLRSVWDRLYQEAVRLEAGIQNQREGGAAIETDLDVVNAQGMTARAEQQKALWRAFSPDADDYSDGSGPAWARWLQHRGSPASLECLASPILPGELLDEALWRNAAGAVLTSATLTALGSFDRFRERSGVPATARWKQVSSPFDPAQAEFYVPAMHTEPSDADGHTAELIEKIPHLIGEDQGVLLLFTSRRQMEAVVEGLGSQLPHDILVQGLLSKAVLLDTHRQNIDQGRPSAIFGLASFFEGIDLPGDYCSHVVIAKLPFAVPDDPIAAAHAELLEAQGRDPFMEISVPDAAQKLVQASGRLLRSERDGGRITLLDRRLLTRRYGRAILDSLPRYRFRLEESGSMMQERA